MLTFISRLIAGAASYEAAKAYENHCNQNGTYPSPLGHTIQSHQAIGTPGSHEEAKELMAGFAGAFVDREAETRGADEWDREKAKRAAVQQSEDGLAQQWQ